MMILQMLVIVDMIDLMLEVPSDLLDNNCMMNDEMKSTNNAIDFVTSVSEMIAAYNERGISYDMDELLDKYDLKGFFGIEDLDLSLDLPKDSHKS